MLSCLSPRRPCCGPNAAVTLMPGGDQRVERMGQVRGHRGRMREQRDALALQRRAQLRVGEQAIDAEFHARSGAGRSSAKQARMVEVGLALADARAPSRTCAVRLLDHADRPSAPSASSASRRHRRAPTARSASAARDVAISAARAAIGSSPCPRDSRRSRRRPMRRGREVELDIAALAARLSEQLEAGRLPQARRRASRCAGERQHRQRVGRPSIR